MPITQDFLLVLMADVIELNVPLLLGLEKMDLLRMYFNHTKRMLVSVNEGVGLLVVRRLGRA